MNNIRIDKEIKDALLDGTEEMEKLKQAVWNNIETAINTQEKSSRLTSSESKPRIPITSGLAKVAAAVAFMLILANSKPGMAAIGKVTSILVPEKKIVQELEGMEEESDVTLKESTVGYTLYIDDSYFNLEKLDGKDKITPINKPTDTSLPEMYMEISQATEKTPSQLFSELENELKANFKSVTSTGKVDTPLQALNLRANTGVKWNDKVVVYYLVDNKHGGSFIIKQQYFIEAEEGMGARFANILKEFRLIE